MKKTLLEIVTEILTSMDGDEVNSISDTTESLAVANIVQNAYWDIVSQASFPKMFAPYELEASGHPARPNLMFIPDTALNLLWVKYDQSTTETPQAGLETVTYMDPETFLQRMYSLDATADNVVSYEYTLSSGDTMNIRCHNYMPPSLYTTLDDNLLIFNSFDSGVDTTLQADKSLAYGERKPTFTLSDSFTPDLPDKQFTILRNEAKATAFAELKQTQNANAERKARRGWVTSQKTKRIVNNKEYELNRAPNYGR